MKFGSNTPNSVQIQWFVNLLKIFPMCISTNHIVRRQFNDGECGGKLGWLFSEAWARLSARQRNRDKLASDATSLFFSGVNLSLILKCINIKSGTNRTQPDQAPPSRLFFSRMYLSQIIKRILLKCWSAVVSKFEVYLSQILQCICLNFPNVFLLKK